MVTFVRVFFLRALRFFFFTPPPPLSGSTTKKETFEASLIQAWVLYDMVERLAKFARECIYLHLQTRRRV